jgi:Protein of unknown function (DUF2378)
VNVVIRPEQALTGDLDRAALIQAIPEGYVVKGLFFGRHVQTLGADFDALCSELEEAPRFGRYMPFIDYSRRDYVRIMIAAARKAFPAQALREGIRRLGRQDFAVFAESTWGKVSLAVATYIKSFLLAVPPIYMKIAPGKWVVSAEELDTATVRMKFSPIYGAWEYQLGQIEGAVIAMKSRPTIGVQEVSPGTFQFDVGFESG